METQFPAEEMASSWQSGLQCSIPCSLFCSVTLSESLLFSLFSIDVFKLPQDSQGSGDISEVAFMFFCLHIKVKEIAVQAKKFLSSTMHPKGPV